MHPDNRVTFSLNAPHASEVALFSFELQPILETMTVPMTLEADSLWRVTVGPLPPGLYDYWFELDGLRITDPVGRNVFGQRQGARGFVEIPRPDAAPRPDEWRDVPHGAVTTHWYRSSALGVQRRLHVYIPPDYLPGAGRTYPVLYLLHGAGDDDRIWTALGRANVILDNLIADGAAEPMVVVMTDGIPDVPPNSERLAYWRLVNEAFQKDFIDDVMPYVEARYRVRTDPDGRAIAGLSLGGGQSLLIGLSHLDRFAWIGSFSGATFWLNPVLDQLADRVEQVNEQIRLLWLAIGKDDFLLNQHNQFVGRLGELGIDHEYQETDGHHMWSVWRGYLAEFAPRLWRE